MTSTTLQVGSHSPNDLTANKADEAQSSVPRGPSRWYGIALAALVAVVATVLGNWLPTVGGPVFAILLGLGIRNTIGVMPRSEEHTSELQSRGHLVCRLMRENKKY